MSSAWIQTHTDVFDFLEQDPKTVHLEDIAHALARQVRYNGHTNGYYTVARHSVLLSYATDEYFAPMLFMHDAHEAYMPDCTRPFKGWKPQLFNLIKACEDEIRQTIIARFPILQRYSPAEWSHVTLPDIFICHNEKYHYLGESRRRWELPGRPLVDLPETLFEEALTNTPDLDKEKQLFLDRARELGVVEG
jgi:hypothetical protein